MEFKHVVLLGFQTEINYKKISSFKSNEHIQKEVYGPNYVVYLILISDPVMTLQRKQEENILQFCEFQIGSRFKD